MKAIFSAKIVTRPWTREGIRSVVIVVIVIVAVIARKTGIGLPDMIMLATIASCAAEGRLAPPQRLR